MPELPEVEANRRHLRAWARGRRIVEVAAPPDAREMGGLGPRAFVERLRGRTVLEVDRRGKWILCALSGGAGLGLHLGMTGKITRARPGAAAGAGTPRFVRASFRLDDGSRIDFVDARRFGRLLAAARLDELACRPEIAAIGPDALGELTAPQLAAGLARTGRSVKEAILDQRIAAGVGNLYATEALWHARLHPATPARVVAAERAVVRRLLAGIRRALRHGLRTYAGAEPPQYIEEGGANPFFVYDRAGQPCRRCGTGLRKITLGGRTSAFCPRCQPLAR